jgi:hypothetical protein
MSSRVAAKRSARMVAEEAAMFGHRTLGSAVAVDLDRRVLYIVNLKAGCTSLQVKEDAHTRLHHPPQHRGVF